MSLKRAGSGRTLGPARTINDQPLPGPGLYFAAQTTDAPIGQWKMNEPSGTTMVDSSGNGHDGSYVGGLSLASSVGGWTAPHFVSNTALYGSIPNGAWMNAVDTAITMEGMYYADGAQNSYCTLFGCDNGGSNARKVVLRWDGFAGGPNFAWGTTGGDGTMSGGPAGVTGAWQHAAVTYDGAHVVAYINGTAVLTYAVTGTLHSWPVDVLVGRAGWAAGAWIGYLAGLGWYDKALSAGRVLAHAQAAGVA